MRKQLAPKVSRFWLTSISLHLLALILLLKFVIINPEFKFKEEVFFVAELIKTPDSIFSKSEIEETQKKGQEKEPLPSVVLPNLELPQELQLSQTLLPDPSNLGFRHLSVSDRLGRGRPSSESENAEREKREKMESEPPWRLVQIKSEIKGENRIPDPKEPFKLPASNQSEVKAESLSDIRASAKKAPTKVGSPQKSALIFPYYPNNVSTPSGSSIPQFRELMIELAKGISENQSQNQKKKKVDVAFIIDTTESMLDNIRGVKAYVVDFLEHLKREGLDTAIGLVKFGDLSESKVEAKGVSEDVGAFRNWLHRTELSGGGDLAESGFEAIVSALSDLKFRKGSQKFFIFISDGPIHDSDFDLQSKYSLDQIIEIMRKEGVRIDVVGLDYLPVKQLAWGTGGNWRRIPGVGYLEQKPLDLPFKIYSQLGLEYSIKNGFFEDRIMIYLTAEADWVNLSWKVLSPIGEKCASGNIENRNLKDLKEDTIELTPKIDLSRLDLLDLQFSRLNFSVYPQTYTIIYRITDSNGNSSVLRRTVELSQKNP